MATMDSKMTPASSPGFSAWQPSPDALRSRQARRLHGIYSRIRNCFKCEALAPAHRPACAPADRKFRYIDATWSPVSWYQWGQYDVVSWMADDVITFRGWVHERQGRSRKGSFGATASYALHPDGLSPSTSGRWISAPTVNVSGTLSGKTKPFTLWDLFEGEQCAWCWMVCRQRIFQAGPGGSRVLAESEEVRTLFCHENGGASDTVLPGIQAMPAVDFEIQVPDTEILAELSIRLDFELAGDDSRISFGDYPVRLSFRPWEPVAA
jgi:hypothetical protein